MNKKLKKVYLARKADGLPWGRPPSKFDIKKAIRLRKKGLSWREIAKQVNVCYQTVRRQVEKEAEK